MLLTAGPLTPLDGARILLILYMAALCAVPPWAGIALIGALRREGRSTAVQVAASSVLVTALAPASLILGLGALCLGAIAFGSGCEM